MLIVRVVRKYLSSELPVKNFQHFMLFSAPPTPTFKQQAVSSILEIHYTFTF